MPRGLRNEGKPEPAPEARGRENKRRAWGKPCR